jgi:peptidoglycan/xylan/chitin deacetylase (PgdA/CDA1 family)
VDYLVEKGITAIMFAWGENVERYPEEAEYALKNGMIVGNHSYSHPFFSQISFEECVNEIEKCETVLNELYGKAGMERKYRPFRFPYGDRGGDNQELLQKYFRENGFDKVDDTKITFSSWKEAGLDKEISTLWTFDFAEYNIRKGSDFTEEDVMGKIHYVNPDNGEGLLVDGTHHILLLHAHDETEELVPEYYKHFIDCLLDNGVEFISPEFIKI